MSTTFGIITSTHEEDATEIARRTLDGIHWTDNLAHLLPDDTKVVAMDNSAQGIHTIGDIKKSIIEKNDKLKK